MTSQTVSAATYLIDDLLLFGVLLPEDKDLSPQRLVLPLHLVEVRVQRVLLALHGLHLAVQARDELPRGVRQVLVVWDLSDRRWQHVRGDTSGGYVRENT